MLSLSDLHRASKIDRIPYLIWSGVLMLLKTQLDLLIAHRVFQREWSFWNYIVPGDAHYIAGRSGQFYLTLLLVSLPFIYLAVTLSLRRLRAAGLPRALAFFLFLPIVNLLLFLVLCLVPSQVALELEPSWPVLPPPRRRPYRRTEDRFMSSLVPRSGIGSAIAGVLVTAALTVGGTLIGTQVFGHYGFGLFIALPLCLGLTTTLIYGYHERRTWSDCFWVSMLALLISVSWLIFFAMEGLACIVMAAPIAVPLVWIGAMIGYGLQDMPRRQSELVFLAALLFSPSYMTLEHWKNDTPPTLQQVSTLDINAPPDVVWKKLTTFTSLPPPQEFIFRNGIGYPTQVMRCGHGVDGMLLTEFSTGVAIQPITAWDVNHTLAFDVSSNPAPMRETTIYAEIHPAHLHGFMTALRGRYTLTALPGGQTRLEATTWYRHSMWPVNYWQLWTQYILDRVHLRVMEHVKAEAETLTTAGN